MLEDERDEGPGPLFQYVDGFCLPTRFRPEAFRSALTYGPRPDDLFIVTYPRSGTTWVQTIVTSIYGNGKPIDSPSEFRRQAPFLELTGSEAFHMTPYSKTAKYIFVARNPKDCLVSNYHHHVDKHPIDFENCTFDVFFDLFMAGKIAFGDYFTTLVSWYEHRNDENVLFLTYEQLKKDTKTEILKIAEFMGSKYKEAVESNTDMMSAIMTNSSFEVMKEFHKKPNSKQEDIGSNSSKLAVTPSKEKRGVYHHIRKGVIGDWRNYFSENQSEKMNTKFRERTEGTDIPKLWEDDM